GETVEQGATADVFHRGRHPYTRALLAAVPKLGSMHGHAWPLRFPIVDIGTGKASEPTEVAETVDTRKTPVLSVKNLVTQFPIRSGLFGRQTGAVHAVEDISFELFQGETLSIVGESGCGKSTTGRSITRLVEPRSGEIHLDGYNVLTLDQASLRAMRRSVQMIFQDPYSSLNPRMRVERIIAEPIRHHGLAETDAEIRLIVNDLLEIVGLGGSAARKFPHEFSGGQRQRIAIARALATRPRFLICDEPTSALDVSIQAQILNLLKDLRDALDLTVLFISHDLPVVRQMCDRVIVMRQGAIVEEADVDDLFERPQSDYAKELLRLMPSL
ncbi:MAG: ABC transporter ATP-binding protein, partial [Thioclava sp.]